MEIGYAVQVLSGLCGGPCGVPSRERDRPGWRKWLLPAAGTRDEASDQRDRNLRKHRLSGFPVVVDTSGVRKLEAKGDHSTIGTTTSAFRKAYTVVTFGPIFKFEASSAFAALAAKNPAGPALGTLPDIALLPGAVAIKVGDEIVAALGVGGSPGGDKDEVCAQAGVTSIKDDLPSPR